MENVDRPPFNLLHAIIGTLVNLYVKFCMLTTRWHVKGQDTLDKSVQYPDGLIIVFWHANLLLSPGVWPTKKRLIYGLVSKSKDGDLIVAAMRRMGFAAVRGSSVKPTAKDKDKGGSQALRDMVRLLRDKHVVAIPPDGPRGPACVIGDGPSLLSRISNAPVMVANMSVKPAIRLKTWDRFLIPLPFAKGVVVYDGLYNRPETQQLQMALDNAQKYVDDTLEGQS